MTDATVLDASLGRPNSGTPSAPMALPSVVSACTTSLYIDESYANINEVMHGGAYGVVFDMLTTIALSVVSRPGYWE
jgi:hypothetical protein